MRRLTTALIAVTAFATACVDRSNDYEVITSFDTGVQDVRTDRPRPDVQDATSDTLDETTDTDVVDAFDAYDAPDVADVVDTGPLSDGGQNGTCPGGNATACPATPHATVTCESERCIYRCADGYDDCDGMAANGCEAHPDNDPSNCGACGTTCTGGVPHSTPSCVSGSCEIACVAGYGNCDGDDTNGCEINVQIDPTNCATCGTMCHADPNTTAVCNARVCGTVCDRGWSDCNPSTGDGCETNTDTSMANCGGCGVVCGAGANQTASCAGGTCNRTCTAGYGDCDTNRTNGCETSLTGNVMACGSCGTVCASGPNSHAECNAGVCSLVCDPGFANCDGNRANGCEVNLGTSAANCGTCGTSCSGAINATPVCTASVCGVVCQPNFADCDGAMLNGCEINKTNDRNNCGACGNVCTGATNATAACAASVCTLVCTPGWSNCNGNDSDGCEINTAVSPVNCGTCGTVCNGASHASPVCNTGTCAIRCDTGYLNCDGDTLNGCEYQFTGTGTPVCP